MNGGLGLFIEDREIYFKSRGGVGRALAGCSESLLSPEFGLLLRQVESEDSKLPGASVKVVQSRTHDHCFYSLHTRLFGLVASNALIKQELCLRESSKSDRDVLTWLDFPNVQDASYSLHFATSS